MNNNRQIYFNLTYPISLNTDYGRGECTGIAKRGVRLSLDKEIKEPVVKITVYLPCSKKEIKITLSIIKETENIYGKYEYKGIIAASEEDKIELLRREAILYNIDPILREIYDSEIKKNINMFFTKNVLSHITKMEELYSTVVQDTYYSYEKEKEIELLINEIVLKGYCLELMVNNSSIIDKIQTFFRNLVYTYLEPSELLRKMFLVHSWQDTNFYDVVDAIYNYKILSPNKLWGKYLERIVLKNPYFVGMRNRRNSIIEYMRRFINEKEEDYPLRILQFNCGYGWEMKALIENITPSRKIYFTGIDKQKIIEKTLEYFSYYQYNNIKFNFIAKSKEYENIILGEGKFDFIYLSGAEYYDIDNLKNTIKYLTKFLRENGKLVVSVINSEKDFAPLFVRWFIGWKPLIKTEDEWYYFMKECFPGANIKMENDEFGYNYYFIISKNRQGALCI